MQGRGVGADDTADLRTLRCAKVAEDFWLYLGGLDGLFGQIIGQRHVGLSHQVPNIVAVTAQPAHQIGGLVLQCSAGHPAVTYLDPFELLAQGQRMQPMQFLSNPQPGFIDIQELGRQKVSPGAAFLSTCWFLACNIQELRCGLGYCKGHRILINSPFLSVTELCEIG